MASQLPRTYQLVIVTIAVNKALVLAGEDGGTDSAGNRKPDKDCLPGPFFHPFPTPLPYSQSLFSFTLTLF